MTAFRALEELRLGFMRRAEGCENPDQIERLAFHGVDETYHVHFFGEAYGEGFAELMDAVRREPLAGALRTLAIDGPDSGANGTREWDLSAMAEADVGYPELRTLSVARSAPDAHNRTILGQGFKESGQLGAILTKAPQLETLAAPSAPEPSFFRKLPSGLRHLSVDAGYEPNGFIRELARLDAPPTLARFEWGEYHETYIDGWEARTTPFDDMCALFDAPAARGVKSFVLRNPIYADAELQALRDARPDASLLITCWQSAYVGK